MIECQQIDRWAADAIGTRLEQQTSHSLRLFPLPTLNNPPQNSLSPLSIPTRPTGGSDIFYLIVYFFILHHLAPSPSL